MSEGYLSVLINRQIPDSVWLEKSEEPSSGTTQDPFVVVFEQHFADADVAHRFVVGKLAESGVEEWNGGQFRGATTREVIGLLSKASKGKPPSQPNRENLSLADLPALAESTASSEDHKITPTQYFVGVGVVILLFAILVGIHLGGSPQDVAGATSPQSPITISNVRTYWLYGEPTLDGLVCAPAIAFTVKNNSDSDIKNAMVEGAFKSPASKTFYGNGITFFELPAGYSHDVAVTSRIGRSVALGPCSPHSLPKLTVSVSVSALGLQEMPLIPDKAINTQMIAIYANSRSDEEGPSELERNDFPDNPDLKEMQGDPSYGNQGK